MLNHHASVEENHAFKSDIIPFVKTVSARFFFNISAVTNYILNSNFVTVKGHTRLTHNLLTIACSIEV